MIQKVCQWICCSYKARDVAGCIDMWHPCQAYGLAYLYCDSCCWSFCAPLFIDCKLGDSGKAVEGCAKCFKYCLFACALYCVGCCDGLYNCFEVVKVTCDTGLKVMPTSQKIPNSLRIKLRRPLDWKLAMNPLNQWPLLNNDNSILLLI